MRLYHRTDMADAIVTGGFRNGHGTYLTQSLYEGVWFSNQPLSIHEGAVGNALLVINVPDDVVMPYEWVEEGKPYREFLVPADVINHYGPPAIVED